MEPTKNKKWSKSQRILSLIQTVDMFPERISLNFNGSVRNIGLTIVWDAFLYSINTLGVIKFKFQQQFKLWAHSLLIIYAIS